MHACINACDACDVIWYLSFHILRGVSGWGYVYRCMYDPVCARDVLYVGDKIKNLCHLTNSSIEVHDMLRV